MQNRIIRSIDMLTSGIYLRSRTYPMFGMMIYPQTIAQINVENVEKKALLDSEELRQKHIQHLKLPEYITYYWFLLSDNTFVVYGKSENKEVNEYLYTIGEIVLSDPTHSSPEIKEALEIDVTKK